MRQSLARRALWVLTGRMHHCVSSRALGWLLVLGGALPLGFALVAQYGFGLPPCHFCLLQRYPYALPLLAGMLWLLLRPRAALRRALLGVAALGWVATAGLGLYHTGIERGWVAYRGGCVADMRAAASLEDLRAQVLAAPRISCADAAASFLGLSMASWNSITALGLALLSGFAYLRLKEAAP